MIFKGCQWFNCVVQLSDRLDGRFADRFLSDSIVYMDLQWFTMVSISVVQFASRLVTSLLTGLLTDLIICMDPQ